MLPVFDVVLAAAILVSAALALWVRDRIAAVSGFLVTGLLVSLSWLRLGAPDVALAEAAIGAGLTGALLLRSAHRIPCAPSKALPPSLWCAAGALAIAISGAIVWTVTSFGAAPVYPSLVADNLPESGAQNPVTAVLLNFRAWDTLLEIAVLFVALTVVIMVAPARPRTAPLGPLVQPFARVLLPLTVLIGGHLLWQGGHAPGGAFQAGAVLAGGAIALGLSGVIGSKLTRQNGLALLAIAGLAIFALAALAAEVLTGALLGYPAGEAKTWIIAIESALTLSIAATLFLLFFGPAERH
ncbi:multisubunit sodium/proton antiporter MrpB subunit [Aliiruegeria haliotis]|uniref:Multisubunit sodium/proton antiporter MrpB subunit n=1 Tax=Aliiruegeria haliotis TaxID=1280846 RepID=A0A2T0RLU2_9RHOB|nr:hydrogen gas-evolving membrane-bound hydrogenase subunit E [Aliiruegeria haliotis]PRY22101.1 multisubunit sodium/proton antiporter MrpB subunit [Aliiruegeria haliotis]